jgi:hypothetical protein
MTAVTVFNCDHAVRNRWSRLATLYSRSQQAL